MVRDPFRPFDDRLLAVLDIGVDPGDGGLVLGAVAQPHGLLEFVPSEFDLVQADHKAVYHRAEIELHALHESQERMFHESDRAAPQRTPALHLVADIADYGDQSDDCGDDPRHGTRQQGEVQPVLRCGPCPFRCGDNPCPDGHCLGLERHEEHGSCQYAECHP